MLSLLAAAILGAATLPAFNAAPSAAQIEADCRAAIGQFRSITTRLERVRQPSFATVTAPLETAAADLNDALAGDLMAFNVSTNKDARDASLVCSGQVSSALTDVQSDPKLYRVLTAAAGRGERNAYDRKLRAYWMAAMRNGGAALDSSARTEFVKLANELTDLQNSFAANLNEAAPVIAVDAAAVQSVPRDIVATYKRRGNDYLVSVDESSLSFPRYSSQAKARHDFFFAFNNRAGSKNVAIFERALAVRDRMAHILGYQSWADYQLQGDRMARSVPRVEKFLTETSALLRPASNADIDAFAKAIAADEHRSVAALDPWDVARGAYLVKRAHSVDDNAIRQYFPVDHTIAAVLDFYSGLLQIDFERVAEPNAWDPDVIEYHVYDKASHTLMGVTYFDLYPRPGKFNHFANFPVLPARTIGAKRRPPVAIIVGNWPKPAAGEPALLSHGDVVTFFHEFGHDLAALLATPPYETLSNGFRTDFVEAPSQMLENFAWEPSVLRKVSSNVKGGAPLSDAEIANLVASRTVGEAYDQERLIAYSLADLRFHSSGAQVDSSALWRETMHDYFPIFDVAQTEMQVSFGHLMGGYDAGLYAYPWARVYAQDLYTAFSQSGADANAAGLRYRKSILEPARTYEPDEEVRAFLGRPMSPDAYLRGFGLPGSDG